LKNELDVTGFYISGHPLDDYQVEINQFTNVQITDFKDDLKSFKGRELTFAGLVSGAEHKTTKTGKPFGAFNIEDKSGMTRMALFSDNYLNYKQYIANELPLLIKAKVDSRYGQEDSLELKVSSIQLLSEVLDKSVKSLTIHLSVDELNDGHMDFLLEEISKNKGNCSLKFLIFDPSDRTNIEMSSGKYKVLCSDLLRPLQQKGVKFRINT